MPTNHRSSLRSRSQVSRLYLQLWMLAFWQPRFRLVLRTLILRRGRCMAWLWPVRPPKYSLKWIGWEHRGFLSCSVAFSDASRSCPCLKVQEQSWVHFLFLFFLFFFLEGTNPLARMLTARSLFISTLFSVWLLCKPDCRLWSFDLVGDLIYLHPILLGAQGPRDQSKIFAVLELLEPRRWVFHIRQFPSALGFFVQFVSILIRNLFRSTLF